LSKDKYSSYDLSLSFMDEFYATVNAIIVKYDLEISLRLS